MFFNAIQTFIACAPILFIILAICLVVYCFKAKVRIKFKTFKGKSFRPRRGKWGTYTYVGSQGKGKSYSLVEYLVDNSKNIQVFSNILDVKNVDDITYFVGFKQLVEIKDKIDMAHFLGRNFIIFNNKKIILTGKQIIFVYDEIFTELEKKSIVPKDLMDFLCQMRKRQIIFLTTAQVWAEIPLTFRRMCRYQIDCNMFGFFNLGFLIKTFHDAENMKWSNDEQDFLAPITETTITKCRKKIAESYDTRQRVRSKPIDIMPDSALSSQNQGIINQEMAQIPSFLQKE